MSADAGPPAVDDPPHLTDDGPVASGGSISRRLTIALAGVSILTIFAVGVLFYGFLGGYVLRQKQEQLIAHSTAVAGQVEGLWNVAALRPIRTAQSLGILLQIDTQVLPSGGGVTVFLGDQIIAAAGGDQAGGQTALALYPYAAQVGGKGPAATTLELGGETRLIVSAAPVSLGGESGLVMVTLPTSVAISDRRGLFGVLLLSAAIGVGLALVVGLVLSAWLTRPLKRLSASARVMAGGSLAEPVRGAFPGEVYELASSLETMRREVWRSEESLRGFVASAAHELRTPLTSIAGFSQALLDGTADTVEQQRRSAAAIHRESGRLRRLVDALLTLSRYDSGEFQPARVTIDGAALVAEEVERLVEAGLAEPGRVQLVADEEAPLVTDPDMFRQVVANLLRNAVLYGGDDPIETRVASVGGDFLFEVANGGTPIEPADRARVFDRFHRGHPGQRIEGFGLGLALVREICEVLGGSVELLDDYPRTVFRVILPPLPPLPPTSPRS